MGVLEQGSTSGRYSLVPRVLIFPINEDGQVLLLKGASDKRIWPNLWNGLGGHVERGESILEAAVRELREEAGIEGAQWTLCGQVLVDTGTNPGILFYVYKVRNLSGALCPSAEGGLGWFVREEALQMKLVEDLYTLLPMVLRHRPKELPFWGFYRYDEFGQLLMEFSR